MTIAITEEHRELERVARAFLADVDARSTARTLLEANEETLPQWWPRLVELGWLGLHLDEEQGGSGYGLPELVIVLGELGRVGAPGPFLSTVLASAVIQRCGSEQQRARFLPGLSSCVQLGAVALGDQLTFGDGRLVGETTPALGAHLADLILAVVGADVVVIDAADVACRIPPNLDPTRRAAILSVDVPVASSMVIAGAAESAQSLAWTLAAAEAAGGAMRSTEDAAAYAREREQFGRAIGTFQAVKHQCADMLVAAELATATVWDAARAYAAPGDVFGLAAAVAATVAIPAAVGNAERNIQVHGGIGYTWDHDAHLALRRAGALAALFGGSATAKMVTGRMSIGTIRPLALDLPVNIDATRASVRAEIGWVLERSPSERQTALIEGGWVQPHWPIPWGRGAGPLEQLVIDEELAGIERPDYGIGTWIILTLIQQADEEQLERWIRPSLHGALTWCQLFSEPSAGSDAAGIRTRGIRVGGGWSVSGQKVWTSGAQHCNRGFATVRTNVLAAKHEGITMMVIDLGAPGVTIRPLREITGDELFNEVFFDEVFVPDADVVGPVDGGWRVARSTLGNERVSIGSGMFDTAGGVDLLALLAEVGSDGGAEAAVGNLLAERHAMGLLNLRAAQKAVVGAAGGAEGNVAKLLSAEHVQRVARVALELAGPYGAVVGDGAAPGKLLLSARGLSIAGGTSEITRNQIGERLLGLPRDPLTR